METPALVLVPSSPLDRSSSSGSPPLSSKNNSPVSSDASSHTTPPSSYGISPSEEDPQQRNSSESTIFSIYSMYSERRHTWRKSALANSTLPGVSPGNNLNGAKSGSSPREGSRESTSGTGDAVSESLTDSFYQGARNVSQRSSNGSGFFAGSAESSSRHHSYNYTSSPSHSRPQSRPTSRRVGSLMDVHVVATSSGEEPTELPYANGDAHHQNNYDMSLLLATDTGVSSIAADTHGVGLPAKRPRSNVVGPAANAQNGASWGNFLDLTRMDDGQPDLGIGIHSPNPASGKLLGSSSSTPGSATMAGEGETVEKPPRPARPSPPPKQAQQQTHGKSESASTTTSHFGLGLSHNGSISGLDAMSTTHEGYVTAPEQSIESSNSDSYTTPVQRFRVVNGTSPSPSPSPPPLGHHTSLPPRVSITQKGLPLPPSPRPPSRSSSPAIPHVKRQSIILSSASTAPPAQTPPPADRRPSSSIASSSRGSRVPQAGEEPESFFVRNTYAQLDVTGVKGDGYEEGVERTRAKLGHDRRSVQLAAVRNDARGENFRGEISVEELEVLSSVDRYGFLVTPSSERNVLLPSSAFSKPLHPITHATTSSAPSPSSTSMIEPKPPPLSKHLETKRISKWGRMLEAEQRDAGGNVSIWRIKPNKERKLRSRVFKGIPDAWRGGVWEVLVARWVGKGAQAKKQEQGSLDARRLTSTLDELRGEYRMSLERPSGYDVQIDLDVPRTINGHVLFKTRYGQGQRSLFHTLHSFSLHCKECGYCQGMGPLAATLLCYYEPEKVYALLVHFHDEYQMHDIFLPGFPGLLEAIYVQERIMERVVPGVYAAFKKHMISTTSYATKWYITLFANTVPFQTQLRLWDTFLLEGRDVFVVMAVGIVWVLKYYITSSQANFETILSLLSSFFVPEDEDALLRWVERALSDRKLRGDMAGWREEWRGLVREKKDGGVLL